MYLVTLTGKRTNFSVNQSAKFQSCREVLPAQKADFGALLYMREFIEENKSCRKRSAIHDLRVGRIR